jgi:hypothetical protein
MAKTYSVIVNDAEIANSLAGTYYIEYVGK